MHAWTRTIAAAAALLALTPALAVDTQPSYAAPDLTSVRAKIKAKDFKGALAELEPMIESHQHADVYNLLGFAHRKTGNLKQAGTWYGKALDFDPDHKGALEYQGELFIMTGDMARARANLARLVKLCPSGCEERADLEKSIGKAEKGKAKR